MISLLDTLLHKPKWVLASDRPWAQHDDDDDDPFIVLTATKFSES